MAKSKTVSGADDHGSGDQKFRAKYSIPTGVALLKGHRGFMTFDGETVTIARTHVKGPGGPAEPTLIPLASVESVEVKDANIVVNGYVRIVTPSRDGSGAKDLSVYQATSDGYCIMFILGAGQSVNRFRDLILAAIATRNAAPIPLPDNAIVPSWTFSAKMDSVRAKNDETSLAYAVKRDAVAGQAAERRNPAYTESEYRGKYGIPDNSVLAIGVGGYCAFDGRFVTLQNVGALGRLSIGKGVKRIAVGSITAVQIKPAGAIMSGFIQFTLPGGIEMKSSFGSQTSDAAGDENSMLFTQPQEPAFLAFRDAVEEAIDSRSRPAPAAAAESDVMTQLAKLGQLKEFGVLTQEEFEAKKAELLDRI